MSLEGKTALITGASRGIGLAIGRAFASQGANLLLVSRDIKALAGAREQLIADFPKTDVQVFQTDVGAEEQVKALFADLAARKLGFQIVVNNAGVMIDNVLMMMKSEDINTNIRTNLLGTIYMCQAAVKVLIKQRGGSIINLSSIIGSHGSAGQSVYSASKSGVIGLTKSLSKELAPLNIRVNALAPGFIETDLTAGLSEKAADKTLASIPMKRFGKPEDVAGVALFLASDQSAYVTGQVIGVDGGMVI